MLLLHHFSSQLQDYKEPKKTIKYRVVKVEVKDGDGYLYKYYYKVQYKFLWFWLDSRFKHARVIGGHPNYYNPMDTIVYCKIEFYSMEVAKQAIKQYKENKFKIKYKGFCIEKIYPGVYVDKSTFYEKSQGHNPYRTSKTLSEMKEYIDLNLKHFGKETETIVKN